MFHLAQNILRSEQVNFTKKHTDLGLATWEDDMNLSASYWPGREVVAGFVLGLSKFFISFIRFWLGFYEVLLGSFRVKPCKTLVNT